MRAGKKRSTCHWTVARNRIVRCLVAGWIAFVYLPPPQARCASVEIWPSERRSNNTLYCYGNDWNFVLIRFYAADHGIHKLALPGGFTEPTVLEVNMPTDLELLGADLRWVSRVASDYRLQSITLDGRDYNRVCIPLDNETLNARIINGRSQERVWLWFDAPETVDGIVSYKLLYSDEVIAAGSSRLVTAGVIRPGAKLPARFGFYPYGPRHHVPEDDHERMAQFYSRFGIKGFVTGWSPGATADNPAYSAMRRHGLKNIAHLGRLAEKYGPKDAWRGSNPMESGGLVRQMDRVCAGLESEEARQLWEDTHGCFDMTLLDWPAIGPHMNPGYDDQATVAAFAEKHGITENLTEELLKTSYREAYFRFRMEQLSRVLYSLKKTVGSARSVPLCVEQGGGTNRRVDYDVYGNDFHALSPMIYQATPLAYARELIATLASTSVPARKFWPTMTMGWRSANVFRHSPQEFLLDTVVTAAAGCGSVLHWPQMYYIDASWLGIHDGLTRIAQVEDFYLDGTAVDTVGMEGLPYREEKVDLGHRILVLSTPDWKASLISFAHRLGKEYALTLLNYSRSEHAFVHVNVPALAGLYLADPVAEVFQVFDDAGRALVDVAPESPGIWIATAEKRRIDGYRFIEAVEVQSRYESARDAFLADARTGAVALGKVGDITVEYGLTEFAGQERVTLQVRTPSQVVAFGSSGGRVYDWQVEGMARFVSGHNFGTDGMLMDLLWLPASSRWRGDEIEDMDLVQCRNDGNETVVVYEGKFRQGLPGINLRKTYRIRAADTTIDVQIDLHSELVDEVPVVLSYWSHNVFTSEQMHFVGTDKTYETGRGVTSIFTANDLPEALKPHVFMPSNIAGTTGPVYAEFFPQNKSGLVFRMPGNFMNVYRWSTESKHGSEWMSQPIALPDGMTKTLRFSITAVPQATEASLLQVVSEQPAEHSVKTGLLPFTFDQLDGNRLPVHYRIEKAGENAGAAAVSTERDETGSTVVKIDIPREASVRLGTVKRTRLEPDADYLLAVQIKVEGMHHTGKSWHRENKGIRVEVSDTRHGTAWLAIHSDGSTDGWITAILPFSTKPVKESANSSIRFRCENMTGTVYVRNPMIRQKPAGVDIRSSFEMADGTQVFSSNLGLRR